MIINYTNHKEIMAFVYYDSIVNNLPKNMNLCCSLVQDIVEYSFYVQIRQSYHDIVIWYQYVLYNVIVRDGEVVGLCGCDHIYFDIVIVHKLFVRLTVVSLLM